MAASRKSKGPIVIEGYLPIEDLDRGLPRIKQKRRGEHVVILVRKVPYKLERWSRRAVHVRVTIERIQQHGKLQAKSNQDKQKKSRRGHANSNPSGGPAAGV